ncbi:MAG: hypothetical protein IT544_00510 [Rhodobacteraceae bacterium]|nr:hypothetical protein [Paracoccaceae bacterium]
MCDLVTALMISSTVVGGIAQVQAGNAEAAASRYKAQVAEINAKMADRAARDAIERGQIEEQNKRRETAAIMGRQQAAMAANGVDLTFGSPLDTIVDTAMMGEIDALTIRRNAAREAYDYDVQGVNYHADASLSQTNAENAQSAGVMNPLGTVLGGGAKAYGNYKSALVA